MSSGMPRELVSRLEAKIDGLSESIASLRIIAARIEATQEHTRIAATAAALRADGHDTRLTSLEETRSQARGVAWTVKLVWIGGVAAAGFLEWYMHRG